MSSSKFQSCSGAFRMRCVAPCRQCSWKWLIMINTVNVTAIVFRERALWVMLPLSQPEINQYRKAFRQFANRLDDDNVLITMQDMSKLLGELGKTHSETDAKTLFNELEIAADGTGWILDLPTFMVLMLHKGNRKNSRGKRMKGAQYTAQWNTLLVDGTLPSTEIVIADNHSAEEIEFERYRYKSFAPSQSPSIKYPNLQNEYGIEFPTAECQLHKDLNSDGSRSRDSQSRDTTCPSSVLFKDEKHVVPEAQPTESVQDHQIASVHRKRCCIL